MSLFQDRLEQEEPNEPLELFEGELSIQEEDGPKTGDGAIFFDWGRQAPLLHMRLEDGLSDDESDIQFMFDSESLRGIGLLYRRGEAGAYVDDLVPTKYEAIIKDTQIERGERIDSGFFYLVNYCDAERRAPGDFSFALEGLEFQGERIANLTTRQSMKNHSRDFLLTHFVTFQAPDGPISQNKFREIIDGLWRSFAFVAAREVGPVLACGRNRDSAERHDYHGIVAMELCPGRVEPWDARASWSDWKLSEATTTQTAVPRFYEFHGPRREAVEALVHYYTEASGSPNLPTGIILGQACLELLSSLILEEDVIPSDGFKVLRASDQFHTLLRWHDRSPDIPQALLENEVIEEFLEGDNSPRTGPELVAEVRNGLVHLDQEGYGAGTIWADTDALALIKHLILEYVELVLLSELHWDGEYYSRMHRDLR